MTRKHWIRGTVWLGLLVPVALATAVEVGNPQQTATLETITQCVENNEPDSTAHQKVRLETEDRLGSSRDYRAEIFWKKFPNGRSKAFIWISEPLDVRGTGILILETKDSADLFTYLPELGKVRRVTPRTVSGSFLGTDFSYEDIERLQGLSEDSERRLLPDSSIEGRATWVIEGAPQRGKDSKYKRIVSHVDQKTCVSLRTEFFDDKDRLAKVMTSPADQITQEDSGWVPRVVKMEDVPNETSSKLTILELKVGEKISNKYFTQTELVRRGH